MFPLRDFLERHCEPAGATIPEEVRHLFRNPSCGAIFRAGDPAKKLVNATRQFEIAIRGTTQPTVLQSLCVILPDDISCICIVRSDPDVWSATTVVKADVLWATVRVNPVARPNDPQLNDE